MLRAILEERSQNQESKYCIKIFVPFHCWFDCKNSENRWIWVVIRNGTNCIIQLKIVFKRRVVSFPSYYIIRTIFTFCFINLANVFINYRPFLLFVFEPSSRKLKVSWISQAISSDRAQLRKCEVMTKDLGYPTFDLTCNINWKFNASRNYQNLFRPHS